MWRWNAIGEETYAIQNESIPYLLGDNEIEQYAFVTEDGLLDIIDLSENDNDNEEILSIRENLPQDEFFLDDNVSSIVSSESSKIEWVKWVII